MHSTLHNVSKALPLEVLFCAVDGLKGLGLISWGHGRDTFQRTAAVTLLSCVFSCFQTVAAR